MVILSTAPPALSCDVVSLYYTRDVLLENLPVMIFYGPSTTENSTQNSSRVQAHIMSLAGFQSFHRLVVSPSSPLYAAVYHLPEEQQGDDIYRGLAVSLLSYFAGLSDATKAFLKELAERRRPARAVPMMFDEMHAGELASRMTRIKDMANTTAYIKSALATQSISWIDIDVVLPTGTIKRETTFDGQELIPSFDNDGLPLFHYGKLDSLMNLLGSPSFLPTSKLRRALSKPTVHSKSRSLLKDQKVLLRREMCEFVDTENRYVGKLHDLANDMAEKFRQRLKGCGVSSLGSTNIPDALFPQCLSTILQLNKTFFNDIQDILQRTENEAIADIEGVLGLTAGSITKGRKWDPTGASEFAMGLLKWFPQFTSPYHEYVRASVAFSDIINEGLQDSATRFLSLVNEIGEQRLRSSLIEPIQRLPRYSLFIDNMVNLLPASHPALISLLKARDLITDICALDTNSFTDNTRTVKCLKNLIGNWPASISPRGRLICAVDATQLRPPYNLSTGGQASVLLLFPEVLVLLQKTVNSTLTARTILAEIDRPALSVTVSQSRTSRADNGITFQTAMDLVDIQLTESEDKQLVWVTDCNDTDSKALHNFTSVQASPPVIKVFALLNTYERKATRFCEDVTKARIEGRFSETMRESDKWTTRTLNSPSENLSILASIWEDKFANENNPQTSLSQIRLLIDGIEMPRTIFAQNRYLHTVARIICLEDNRYRFIIEGTDGSGSSDDVAGGDLIRVLFKRVSKIIKNHDYKSYASYTYFCRSILQDVPLVEHGHEPQLRNYRPISPVKMLSNFLGGIPQKQNNQIHTTELISLPPPQSSLGPTFERSQSIKEDPSNNVVTMMKQNNSDSRDVSELLEATLSTYLTALYSKSGNVVGKVLRARVEADELVVNELYNTLVEDPSRKEAVAAIPVDILFAAFEKFLNRAWREHMGPLLPSAIIKNMQRSLDSGKPDGFTHYFSHALEDMTPQNKRAFTAIIKLLQDACGNDGDRGILIASFAEALVLEGNPHDYISLFDRLVDDYDKLFDAAYSLEGGQNAESVISSLKRNRSFNTGSLSSNASSLRKKFGMNTFGRENSKPEPESKVTSVWRTLSKTVKNKGETHLKSASLSKASLVRSRSRDRDSCMLPPLRPVSRERPSHDEHHALPGSPHLALSLIDTSGERTPKAPGSLIKKKRRSSLSDLKAIHNFDTDSSQSPLKPPKSDHAQQLNAQARLLPKIPFPHKTALDHQPMKATEGYSPSSSRFGSPRSHGSLQRLQSPEKVMFSSRKENSPLANRNTKLMTAQNPANDSSTLNPSSFQKQINSRTGISIPKPGLSERAIAPNSLTSPKKNCQPFQKLRMQSPQKASITQQQFKHKTLAKPWQLRERLINEQKAFSNAESSLKAELAQIGEDLSAIKFSRSAVETSASRAPTLEALSITLTALSTHLSNTLASLTSHTSSIASDLESSLLVADKKARKLDELYREANAENEALYDRFNEELGKILQSVKTGNGVEELRLQMREAQNEVSKLKCENAKLKKDIMEYKILMRE